MSKRFEGGSGLSADSKDSSLAPGRRVTVERSIRRTVQLCNNGEDIDGMDGGGETSADDDKMIKGRQSSSGGGRSFLSDRSPVENVSDVLARMRSTQGDDECRNLLNKFLGAQVSP